MLSLLECLMNKIQVIAKIDTMDNVENDTLESKLKFGKNMDSLDSSKNEQQKTQIMEEFSIDNGQKNNVSS